VSVLGRPRAIPSAVTGRCEVHVRGVMIADALKDAITVGDALDEHVPDAGVLGKPVVHDPGRGVISIEGRL
jgi:hypothetical protein